MRNHDDHPEDFDSSHLDATEEQQAEMDAELEAEYAAEYAARFGAEMDQAEREAAAEADAEEARHLDELSVEHLAREAARWRHPVMAAELGRVHQAALDADVVEDAITLWLAEWAPYAPAITPERPTVQAFLFGGVTREPQRWIGVALHERAARAGLPPLSEMFTAGEAAARAGKYAHGGMYERFSPNRTGVDAVQAFLDT